MSSSIAISLRPLAHARDEAEAVASDHERHLRLIHAQNRYSTFKAFLHILLHPEYAEYPRAVRACKTVYELGGPVSMTDEVQTTSHGYLSRWSDPNGKDFPLVLKAYKITRVAAREVDELKDEIVVRDEDLHMICYDCFLASKAGETVRKLTFKPYGKDEAEDKTEKLHLLCKHNQAK